MQHDQIAAVAERHGLSRGAVEALAEALRRGQGSAQWSHPDLGGMGQWLRGGMLQIGDMFNDDLKARVRATLEDLAADPTQAPSSAEPGVRGWWPAALGTPSSSGAQNAMRYACFPDRRRLAVEQDGQVKVYDTGVHRLTGFAQQQSGGSRSLRFDGPDGTVTLVDLIAID